MSFGEFSICRIHWKASRGEKREETLREFIGRSDGPFSRISVNGKENKISSGQIRSSGSVPGKDTSRVTGLVESRLISSSYPDGNLIPGGTKI